MYDPEQVRANRAYYLSRGLCPVCGGKNPVRAGMKSCLDCAVRAGEYRKKRSERLRAAGLCTVCGGTVEDVNYVTCRACRAKSNRFYWRNKR